MAAKRKRRKMYSFNRHALEAYMIKENLSQAQLAKRLGVSKGMVSRILSGHCNPGTKTMLGLRRLGFDPTSLFIDANTVQNYNTPGADRATG